MQESAYPSAHRGRQDSRHPQGRRQRGNRPLSSVNLGRLADAMGLDLLASSLGMTEPVLLKVIQGGEGSSDYQAHIAHRMKEAGLSGGWLNQTNPPINDALIRALQKVAAKSTNRAPIRRQNIQTLVDAFEGRIEALADALDLIESSVLGMVEGRLAVDDERFNHLNPRLMEGGFPNGWLDEPQATLNPAWIAKLEAVATAAHQQEEEEQEHSRRAHRAEREAHAAASTATPPSAPQDAQAPDASAAAEAVEPAEKPQALLFTPDQDVLEGSQAATASRPAAETQPALADSSLTSPPATTETHIMAKPPLPSLKKSGDFAAASQPPGAPKIPRGAMKSGYAVTVGSGKAAGGKLAGGKIRSIPQAKAAAAPAKSPNAASKAAAQQPALAPHTTESAATSTAVDHTKLSHRAGKSPISREQSLKRAGALEKLLDQGRRGLKTTLWNDLVGLSLPYWGNIRRGAVMLRDELANDITAALGLPEGWLDNPTFPPESLHAWVMDPTLELPKANPSGAPSTSATKAAKASPGPRQPFSRPNLPAPTAQMVAPSATVSMTPSAPTAVLASAPVGAHAALNEPGPLVQALNAVILKQALAGTFTEEDALALIVQLSSKK